MDIDDGSGYMKFTGSEPQERITRLCNYAIQLMREHHDYREDDKIGILICNGVTKSDWDRVEFGSGFWNFTGPNEALNILLQHVINLGEHYGVGIDVMEARAEQVEVDPEAILQAALRHIVDTIKKGEGNAAGENRTGE